MLKNLYIRNYAIIDELNIDFSDGFNVFTGETGAGKSIIVGALSFLTRGKADTSIIRNGADSAVIEGIFSIDDYMKEILDEGGIEYDDELIIRRTISTDNRNSIRINQFSVTLAFLSRLFGEHIDIHSQKDSQYLLNKRNHLLLLDRYAALNDDLKAYKDAYDEYDRAYKEYDELLNHTYSEAEFDYLKFDYNELENAKIDPEEEKDLQDKEKRYKSAEKYLTVLSQAVGLYEDDEGIREKLSTLFHSLNLEDDAISKIRSNIESLYYSLDDEMESLKQILSSFSEEDLNIEYIEERLYLYSKLKRKYDTDVAGLLAKKEELSSRIAFYEDKDYVLSEKKKHVDELHEKAYQLAEKISQIRKEKALQLENDIIRHCNDLMLNNVVFKVRIDKCEMGRNGIDDVEFYVSTNKGEEPKPLKNTASGGEISRLMLALKTVFTSLSECSLAVFDEIDTGVSGKTAMAIGKKMAQIARYTQVLTITHLAAVAACAKTHFYIYKDDSQNYSRTLIRKLDHDEIINELAMISSLEVSPSALKAAQDLYDLGQKDNGNEA